MSDPLAKILKNLESKRFTDNDSKHAEYKERQSHDYGGNRNAHAYSKKYVSPLQEKWDNERGEMFRRSEQWLETGRDINRQGRNIFIFLVLILLGLIAVLVVVFKK